MNLASVNFGLFLEASIVFWLFSKGVECKVFPGDTRHWKDFTGSWRQRDDFMGFKSSIETSIFAPP